MEYNVHFRRFLIHFIMVSYSIGLSAALWHFFISPIPPLIIVAFIVQAALISYRMSKKFYS
jgi:CHASE2 domain-containing sensor protein